MEIQDKKKINGKVRENAFSCLVAPSHHFITRVDPNHHLLQTDRTSLEPYCNWYDVQKAYVDVDHIKDNSGNGLFFMTDA